MITKEKKKHTGDFKQRAYFEYVTVSDDGMGGGVESWTKLTDDWFNIIPLSASQRLQMGAQGVGTTHRIQVRYRDDLDTLGYAKKKYNNELRLIYAERIFNIQYVINEYEESYYFEMAAEEWE